MKVLIEIDEEVYKWINEHKGVTDFKTTEMLYNRVRDGISLNGTNGEVLLRMFPPSVYFPSDGTYMVLLTKDCLVSCSNADWWNADYKAESEAKHTDKGCESCKYEDEPEFTSPCLDCSRNHKDMWEAKR